MGQLQKIETELVNLGYSILGISPDRPEKLAESIGKQDLKYRLVSDSGMAAAQAFGVAYRVPDEYFGALKGFGVDLEEVSGETHHGLPVPSVFVVSKEGKVLFQYANPDYKVRLKPEILLTVAAVHQTSDTQ